MIGNLEQRKTQIINKWKQKQRLKVALNLRIVKSTRMIPKWEANAELGIL